MDNYFAVPFPVDGSPCFDPKCIADHKNGDSYCVHGPSETLVVEEFVYEVPTAEAESALPAVDSVSGYPDTLETSKKLTEAEKAWKRWTDSWLEGIDYKTEVKPRTGRRQFRNERAGNGMVRKLPRVRGCGHPLDLKQQPRHRNCKSCWTAFFRNQDEMSENIAKVIVEQGQDRISETFGKKFLTSFHEYCKLVERMESLRLAYAEEQKQLEEITRELAVDNAEGEVSA